MLIQELIEERVNPDGDDGRDNGGVVAHEHHGDAEELAHGAVARIAHQADKIGIEQTGADQSRQVRARTEAFARGEA